MRCRKFCIRNGVANGSNIYNVVSDEYFKQRLKRYKPWMQPENWANQHLILWRNLFSMGLIPVCLRTLWEGYSQNRKYRILHLKLLRPIRTASHSLLLSARRQASLSNWPTGGERSLSLPCLMLVNLMTHNRVRLLILMSWQMLVALKPLLTLLIHIVNLISLSIRFWHCWFTI